MEQTPRFTLNVPRFNRLPLHPQVEEIIGEFASFTLLEVDNSKRESFEVRAKRLQEQLWQDLDTSTSAACAFCENSPKRKAQPPR